MTRSITRREAIAVVAGVTAASTSTAALAATPAPHPWDRANDLARELSIVLSEGDGAFHGPGGRFYAHVQPATADSLPIAFVNIKARELRDTVASVQMTDAIEAHRAAREAFNKAISETDRPSSSKAALRRYHKADKAEDLALVALCACRPSNEADGDAKAAYLMPYLSAGELEPHHVKALIKSGVR